MPLMLWKIKHSTNTEKLGSGYNNGKVCLYGFSDNMIYTRIYQKLGKSYKKQGHYSYSYSDLIIIY
jgi:hypothetical protein